MRAPLKPPYRVRQAFLHLEFSVKLFRYFEMGLVRRADFDRATEVSTAEGPVVFGAGTFNTDHDLVLAAQNSYSSALGVCAIALENALLDHGIRNDPSDDSPRGQLRSFVYQIRNAFAHDAMTPSWSAKGPYRRKYDLRPFGLPRVDLNVLDGQALELEDFGGMPAFERLRDAVTRWVTAGEPLSPDTAVHKGAKPRAPDLELLEESGIDYLNVAIGADDIRKSDTRSAIGTLNQLLDSRSRVLQFQQRVSLFFEGYDADTRELYEIPEVRAYIAALDADFPFWFWFLDPKGASLLIVAASCCDLSANRGAVEARVSLERASMIRFLEDHFDALNRLAETYELPEPDLAHISDSVGAFFTGH
jgi:hypothetical protein